MWYGGHWGDQSFALSHANTACDTIGSCMKFVVITATHLRLSLSTYTESVPLVHQNLIAPVCPIVYLGYILSGVNVYRAIFVSILHENENIIDEVHVEGQWYIRWVSNLHPGG